MSLGEQVVQELMQMGGAELPLTIKTSVSGRSASAQFSQWSPLAVGVDLIQIEGNAATANLSDLAGQLAAKLNYLSEPIHVFEVDSQSSQAQLRSNPPKTLSDAVEYFEIRLASDGTRWLHRYRATPGGPRTSTPFTLTLEMLSRVIDDLATG